MTGHASAVVATQETLASVGLGEHFRITERGLTVDGQPSFKSCEQLWETLLTIEKVTQIAIGDAMRYFRERWGERASQIVSARTGWSLETLRNYEWISDSVPQEVRRFDKLTLTHHQKVARLQPREQKKWLDKAAEDDTPWSVNRLTQAIRAGADVAPTAWGVVAFCDSEPARDAALKDLESRGFRCKAVERRGGGK